MTTDLRAAPPTVSRPTPTTPLCVVSYNLRVDRDNRPYRWLDRLARVVANIQQLDADVVCIQESSPRYVADLLAQLKDYAAVRSAWRSIESNETCDVLYRVARLAVERSTTFQMRAGGKVDMCSESKCSAPNDLGDTHPRIVLGARFVVDAQWPLIVLCTHFPLLVEKQPSALQSLEQVWMAMGRSTDALVIGGDFNRIVPTSAHWRVVGDTTRSTFRPGFRAIDATVPRLDYLCVRNLDVVEEGVLEAEMQPGSDHCAVWMRVDRTV